MGKKAKNISYEVFHGTNTNSLPSPNETFFILRLHIGLNLDESKLRSNPNSNPGHTIPDPNTHPNPDLTEALIASTPVSIPDPHETSTSKK